MADTSGRGSRQDRSHSPYRRKRQSPSNGHHIDPELLAKLDREEPLSIAEELDKAAERVRRVGAPSPKATSPIPTSTSPSCSGCRCPS